MELHRAQGVRVYIVSSSPEEVVRPLAGRRRRGRHRHPGRDRGRQVHGRAGLLLPGGCQGRSHPRARRHRWLRPGPESYAYSDSITDGPMLEAVGNPVAVNPDRETRSWPANGAGRSGAPAPGATAPANSRVAPAAQRGPGAGLCRRRRGRGVVRASPATRPPPGGESEPQPRQSNGVSADAGFDSGASPPSTALTWYRWVGSTEAGVDIPVVFRPEMDAMAWNRPVGVALRYTRYPSAERVRVGVHDTVARKANRPSHSPWARTVVGANNVGGAFGGGLGGAEGDGIQVDGGGCVYLLAPLRVCSSSPCATWSMAAR